MPATAESPTTDASLAVDALPLYGEQYQREQVAKYRSRHDNHWRIRLDLAAALHGRFAAPMLGGRDPSDVTVVDVGCSIGTFAIDYARRGYRAYGIDFDESALQVARALADEEGVDATFIRGDASAWDPALGPIDIAICFDIFEHLFDDQLGVLLNGLRRNLAPNGVLLFHTFPAEFDYIFFQGSRKWWPLSMIRWMSRRPLYRCTRAYACLIDAWYALRYGRVRRELTEDSSHCNPLTRRRLEQLLQRAGFEILSLEARTLYEWSPGVQRRFRSLELAQRNLFGAARPRPN